MSKIHQAFFTNNLLVGNIMVIYNVSELLLGNDEQMTVSARIRKL